MVRLFQEIGQCFLNGQFLALFSSFWSFLCNWQKYRMIKIDEVIQTPMVGFEPWISGVGKYGSVNWVTTTDTDHFWTRVTLQEGRSLCNFWHSELELWIHFLWSNQRQSFLTGLKNYWQAPSCNWNQFRGNLLNHLSHRHYHLNTTFTVSQSTILFAGKHRFIDFSGFTPLGKLIQENLDGRFCSPVEEASSVRPSGHAFDSWPTFVSF